MTPHLLSDRITPLGSHVSFELVDGDLNQRLDHYHPNLSGADLKKLRKIFKLDFCVERIVEKIDNVDLIHLQSSFGRGDELYYFRNTNGKLFHGDLIWSTYHPFVDKLQQLKASEYITEPAWFVGSRNNYTHQLIDFYPNLLLRKKNEFKLLPTSMPNIIGSKTDILNDIHYIHGDKSEYSHGNMQFLSSIAKNQYSLNNWSISVTHFKQLYLVKHISIFTAFDLLEEYFAFAKSIPSKKRLKIGFITRHDDRIANQSELIEHLSSKWNADTLSDIHLLSFAQKQDILSKFNIIIVPPGSDNINTFLFTSKLTYIIQLNPFEKTFDQNNPFHTFACIRYQLANMERTITVPKTVNPRCISDGYSGIWSRKNIDDAIHKAMRRIEVGDFNH